MHYVSARGVDVPVPIVAVACYVLALRLCDVANNAVMNAAMNREPWQPLPDVGHRWLPLLDHTDPASWFFGMPDFLFLINFATTCAVCGYLARTREHRWMLVAEALAVHGTLLMMRATTILVTTLPTPIPGCRGRAQEDGPAPSALSLVYCNDQIFSGHTTGNVLCLCLGWCTTISVQWKAAWTALVFVVITVSIATRDHYTVDCLVATYITVAVFLARRSSFRRRFVVDTTARRFV